MHVLISMLKSLFSFLWVQCSHSGNIMKTEYKCVSLCVCVHLWIGVKVNWRTQILPSHSGEAVSQRWHAAAGMSAARAQGLTVQRWCSSETSSLSSPPFPQGAQQQTTNERISEGNVEKEKEGSLGQREVDNKAALPARGQPVLFIQVWLVCLRAWCQQNLFFSLSYQRLWVWNRGESMGIVLILYLKTNANAWMKMLKL